MDLFNKYSGIVSLLALILALPIGILGTLIAPKIQNQLALRSRKTIAKKIQQLEVQLVSTENMIKKPTFAVIEFAHHVADMIMLSIVIGLTILVYVGVQYLMRDTLAVPITHPITSAIAATFVVQGIVLFLLYLGLFLFWRKFEAIHRMYMRIVNFSSWRMKTQEQIAALTEKLDQ